MHPDRSTLSLWAYRLYLAGLFLLPLGVFASVTTALLPLKVMIAVVTLGLATLLVLFSILKRGAVTIPVNWLVFAVWPLPVVYLIASLFSPSWMLSLTGYQLDTDTAAFMVLFALAVTLPFAVFQSRSDILRAFFALLVAAWIVAVVQILRLVVGPEFLSFGIFTSSLFTLIGKWNDLSIFFGFTAILSLITLEALPLEPRHRWVLRATLAVSIFFVALVNFFPVWACLGVLSLGIVLYRAVMSRSGDARFSWAATIILLLAILMMVFSSTLGTFLGTTFNAIQIEARPSFTSTVAVATQVLKTSPIVGSGPNTFLLDWDKYRPQELNQSIFWNADFTSGVGMIPTSVVTAGMLGFLVWLLIIGLYAWMGVSALLLRPASDTYAYHLMLSTYAGGLYLLLMGLVYLPSPALLIIGAASIGMFASLTHKEQGARTIDLVFAERPRIGFVAVLVVALLVVGTVMGMYGAGTIYAADLAYNSASYQVSVKGDLETAGTEVTRALALSPEDRFYRLAVLININKLNNLIQDNTNTKTAEEAQKDFQSLLGSAVEDGLSAVRIDNVDYRNWQALGSAYHSVVSLNITGAYDSALAAYTKAGELNPAMPAVPLARAQLEVSRGDSNAARPFIDQALALKADYIPAILLLAQIELAAGNLKEAIAKAKSASVFEPSNPITHFQVGVLEFSDKDYTGAQAQFEAAVGLTPDYANAHYYLGRVYLIQGKTEDALKEFEKVQDLNPDNADVASVITAIKEGKDPFAPAPAATTTKAK